MMFFIHSGFIFSVVVTFVTITLTKQSDKCKINTLHVTVGTWMDIWWCEWFEPLTITLITCWHTKSVSNQWLWKLLVYQISLDSHWVRSSYGRQRWSIYFVVTASKCMYSGNPFTLWIWSFSVHYLECSSSCVQQRAAPPPHCHYSTWQPQIHCCQLRHKAPTVHPTHLHTTQCEKEEKQNKLR